MDVDPIGILLVKSDSKGHRLLFRYPYLESTECEYTEKVSRKTPYSLQTADTSLYGSLQVKQTEETRFAEFPDDVLSNLFAVKSNLTGRKFELKINEIRFVGHPIMIRQCTRIEITQKKIDLPAFVMVHVVFALKASTDYSAVKAYHDLSKRIAIAIKHEESRCGYFLQEMKVMMMAHENISNGNDDVLEEIIQTPFDIILKECTLARNLKFIYESICLTGIVRFRLNNWIEVSCCFTQKVHAIYIPGFSVSPEEIERCMQNLKPYHGILLLEDTIKLLKLLPPDASPSVIRLLKVYSPIKNFQMISTDSDLTITQVYNLVEHFLNWGIAMIIYPLCETNVYVVAPGATISSKMQFEEEFSSQFQDYRLNEIMSEFSLPTPLLQKLNPTSYPEERATVVQIIIWLLRRRMIMQLHTYIYFMPTKKGLVPQLEDLPLMSHSRYQSLSAAYHNGIDFDMYSLRAPSDSDLSSAVSDDFVKFHTGALHGDFNSWLDVIEEGDKLGELEDDFVAIFSEEEKSALMMIPASKDPDHFHLLIRLLKEGYLHGASHLEEIMYSENISRSKLVQLIEKFKDVLITCESADPTVSVFYP